MTLPSWAYEAEDMQQRCKHCGDIITVICALSCLGENGSFFCDAKNPDTGKMHEIATN